MKKRVFTAAACALTLLLTLVGSTMAADTPAPGTVINKSNIDQYKHLFPAEFLGAFTTGWGLLDPFSITVKTPEPNPLHPTWIELSKKNRGKYSLNSEGYITGGHFKDIIGFPFPDTKPGDENFALKYMWNFEYRYQYDDQFIKFYSFNKRRGEKCNVDLVENFNMFFQGRLFDDPKPLYDNANDFRSCILIRILDPPVQRNFITTMIRYMDPRKDDVTYMYLPSMRRVLRGEAGERSTPVMGSTQAPDDFNGFAGRIADFTYEFKGEETVLAVTHSNLGFESVKDPKGYENLPFETENWEPVPCYVIDITPKNPKYPQSLKRIYVDKRNYQTHYTFAWDRGGKLWKLWCLSAKPTKASDNGDVTPWTSCVLGMDIQLGYGTSVIGNWENNGHGYTDTDFSIAAMRKMGR